MTVYRFFSIQKMFWLQRQFNNIVETTQLNNDQMPEFHCHCETHFVQISDTVADISFSYPFFNCVQ